MARPKSNVSTTSPEKNQVEAAETTIENTEEKTTETKVEETKVEETKETVDEKKEIKFGDDSDVEIICKELAGKSVVTTDPKNPIYFDESGKATVKGAIAKKLLTIPGYSLA